MPNGRSGMFAMTKLDLERLLIPMEPSTRVAYRLRLEKGRPEAMTVGDVLVALAGAESDSFFVEQQDGSSYIIHLSQAHETWICIGHESPVREALTRSMGEWHQKHK